MSLSGKLLFSCFDFSSTNQGRYGVICTLIFCKSEVSFHLHTLSHTLTYAFQTRVFYTAAVICPTFFCKLFTNRTSIMRLLDSHDSNNTTRDAITVLLKLKRTRKKIQCHFAQRINHRALKFTLQSIQSKMKS